MEGDAFNYRALKGRGLQMDTLMDFATSNYLRVRVVESTRASQCDAFQPHISRTVRIRMGRMAARLANKAVSRLPVCLLRVTTLTALLARVARINLNEIYSRQLRFVGKKSSQLSERPTVQLCPLALLSSYPLADSIQLLYGDSAFGAFGERDDASRNYMVRIGRKPLFLAAALLQKSISRLRADTLQLATKCSIAVANLIEFCATVFVAVRVHGDFHDAEVNAQNVNSLNLFFFRHFNRDIQKPLLLTQNQVGLATRIGEQDPLLVTADKRHLSATIDRPDTYRGGNQVQGQDARIIGDAAMLAKRALNFLIQLVAVGNFGVQQAHDLSRQRKLIAYLPVKNLVERKPSKLFLIPSQLRQAIASGVCSLQSFTQGQRLLWSRQQLNLDSQFHLA